MAPIPTPETFPVHEGWNFVNFHVEPADDAINWSDLQFRPDFDPNDPNPTANVSVYYIDHVHLPQATLLAESSIPASADFLAGPVAPDATLDQVVSLFSDAHDSSVMVGGSFRTDWSDAGEVTDIDVSGNTVKKFETVRYVGIEPMAAIDITGMNTLFISLYKTTPSAFEVKLVDWGAEDTWSPSLSESRYVIPETEMPVGEWVTIEIPLSDFEGPVSSGSPNINQLVFAPFDPATDQPTDETFYMDDGLSRPSTGRPMRTATWQLPWTRSLTMPSLATLP